MRNYLPENIKQFQGIVRQPLFPFFEIVVEQSNAC